MGKLRFQVFVAFMGVVFVGLQACGGVGDAATEPAGEDAAFAALQERGRQVMGVVQYTSTHRFDALPDGGRIELQRDVEDPDGAATIRAHLQQIKRAFEAGDFSTPAFVHMQTVPGTEVMAARRDAIAYEYRELPRGGELRIATRDPEAIAAIHAFMAFQRDDHRAGGMGRGHGHHGGEHGHDHEQCPMHGAGHDHDGDHAQCPMHGGGAHEHGGGGAHEHGGPDPDHETTGR